MLLEVASEIGGDNDSVNLLHSMTSTKHSMRLPTSKTAATVESERIIFLDNWIDAKSKQAAVATHVDYTLVHRPFDRIRLDFIL